MERGAAARLPRGRLRHRAAHLTGQLVRIPGQGDQGGHRQPGRQHDLDGAVAAGEVLLALGEQQAGVEFPGRDQLPLRVAELVVRGPPAGGRRRGRRVGRRRGSSSPGSASPGCRAAPLDQGGRRGDRGVPPAGRGRGPVRLVDLGEQRVLRVLRRLVRPLVDRARACLASRAHLGEEHRRAERRGRLAPPVAGAAEPERGPRRRDVGEPALLRQVAGRARLVELRDGVRVERGQRGQVGGVAAQRERDQPRVVRPPRRRRGRAGKTCDFSPAASPGTKTAGHCRPLAACTVSSLTVSDSPTRPGLEAELLLLGGRQVGEERAERRLRLVARERDGDVGEGVQVGPRRGQVAARPRGHLDVEAERPLHLGDEVGERPGHVLAQPPGLRGERRQPGVPGRRVLRRVAEVVERLDQRRGAVAWSGR